MAKWWCRRPVSMITKSGPDLADLPGHEVFVGLAADGQAGNAVSLRHDPRAYPEQHRSGAAGELLDAVDVVEAVYRDIADVGVKGSLDVGVGLGVAVHDDAGRVHPRGQRDTQLASPDDIAPQALLREDPDDRRGRVGLRREADAAAGMPAGKRVQVIPGTRAQCCLVDHVGRRAELPCYLTDQAAADRQVRARRD